MSERASFLASFAQIQSAIKLGPDGARIQLDIPESELDNAAPAFRWRDRVLRVTIEPESRQISAGGHNSQDDEQAEARPKATERAAAADVRMAGRRLRHAPDNPLGQ